MAKNNKNRNRNRNKNNSPRSGSVKANRAAGTNKAAQNKAAKGPSSSSSPKPARRQQAKAAAQMSVKDRRAGAKAAGVSLKDFKQGKTGAKAVARKTAQVNRNMGGGNTGGMMRGGGMYGKDVYNPNSPDYGDYSKPENNSPTPGKIRSENPTNTFTTAAGYQMEKGAYNTRSKEMYEKYRTDNPKAGTSHMTPDNASFDEDGYLSYDSTKPQWQANNMLKEAGYKAGDMLWRPGSLDNLNGRKLTGRIAKISEGGIYHPEYEYDAVNSSHRSTGNPGYQGEVGLGADQYSYNRAYEQNNDVESGQVNHQLQNNYGSSQSDFEAPAQAASNFDYQMPNVQQSMKPQYQDWQEQMGNATQSPYASRSKSSKMNFNLNPYKFQQGQ